MQATDKFNEVINDHLHKKAETDPLFAETLKKSNKNINDCITYILNTVKKSGRNGFSDDEIFGMAVHYYDEDDITVGKPVSGKVVVNHSIGSDQKQVERPAKDKKNPDVKAKKAILTQNSLFDSI